MDRCDYLFVLVLALSIWSARSCDVDRAAGGSDELSFVDGSSSRGSIFYVPASGCSGALESVTLTLVDGTVSSFDRGTSQAMVIARAVDKSGNIVNSTTNAISSADSGKYTWTWDPPVQVIPVNHVVHPSFYTRGESFPPLTDEYVIAFQSVNNPSVLLHIEVDLVSEPMEDDVLVVYTDNFNIGPALEDSVAAVDRRDHSFGSPNGELAVNPAIEMTFVDAGVLPSAIRHVQQSGQEFTTSGLPLVNGRENVVFEVEYDGDTEVNATDAECKNCEVQSIVAIGATKRAIGSAFHVTVRPSCEGLVTLCIAGLCASVNNISCVLSVLSSV